MQCVYIKRDGTQCRCSAIHGLDKCLWHMDPFIRQEIEESPLSQAEQVKIITRRIRSLNQCQRGSGSALEKARECRALVSLLREIEGEEVNNKSKGEKTLKDYLK